MQIADEITGNNEKPAVVHEVHNGAPLLAMPIDGVIDGWISRDCSSPQLTVGRGLMMSTRIEQKKSNIDALLSDDVTAP